MRLRPSDYLGLLLLSLSLVVGFALSAPPAASAQQWSTIGCAGTTDPGSAAVVCNGPDATLTGRPSATIRYAVPMGVAGFPSPPDVSTPRMWVTYRTPAGISPRDNSVDVKLIELNRSTGVSTTILDLNSNDFPQAFDFATQLVNACPGPVIDFSQNTYFVEVVLFHFLPGSGLPTIRAIMVENSCLF